MMEFEKPGYLVLLWVIPILAWVLFDFNRRQKLKIEAIGDKELVDNLLVGRNEKNANISSFSFLLGLALLIVGFANPRIGKKETTLANTGVDIIFALDLSKSMEAEDLKPNRLLRSKAFISGIMQKMHGNRVGFVVFAGNAFMQMPLTVDYSAFEMYLENAVPTLIQNQGTAIGEAILVSERAFYYGDKSYKTLVIISDGETFDDEAIKNAKSALKNGTKIFTIGVGEDAGGPIPEYDESGNLIGNKKDENGNEIISKMNEKTLTEIAEAGGGKYFKLKSGKKTEDALFDAIDKQEKRKYKEKLFLDYSSKFQYFIGASLFLFLFSFTYKSLNINFYRKMNDE